MTALLKHFFIRAYLVINTLILINVGFMTPLWSDFVEHIGGDIRTAGKAVLLFSIVIGGVTCIAGHIESRLQKDRFFMIAAQAMMCVGYAGYFYVRTPVELYVVQVILALGGAFQSPVLCSLYQHSIPAEKSSYYWGIWNGLYQVAVGVGALCGAYIVHHAGYQQMFSAMFIVSIACLIAIIYVMKQPAT